MLPIDESAAESLREAIEQSRIAMEHPGGVDLETIVAETAYDYWPHRSAWMRARQHAAERASAGHELRGIEAEEREALAAAIGRTQEALRGDGIDLESIVREGSREYWAERGRIEKTSVSRDVDGPALAAMTLMLHDAQGALAPRREGRRPWRDVLYDACAVVLPLVLVPPLLLSLVQGSLALPTIGRLKSIQAFADPEFTVYALMVLFVGIGVLLRAYHLPERRRRVLQFGGALGASLLMAVIGAAYVYGNRTASRLDRMQGALATGLLVALEQSDDLGYVVIPSQSDRSMTVETRVSTASMALLAAHSPGLDGEIRVRLHPASADYYWSLNGRNIPKGRLAIAHIAAFDPEGRSITLRSGGQLRAYPAQLSGVSLPIGSRVAAKIGSDGTISSIIALPPSRPASTGEQRPPRTVLQ